MLLNKNTQTLGITLSVVVFMGALAWASVPLYDLFCRVTGFGGTTQTAPDNTATILDRTIEVRFDASLAHAMPWEFRPVERSVRVRIGETALAFYEAYNPTNFPVAGSASYNVVPYNAGSYFTKIDCFCFTEQILQPKERVLMPVTFFVSPDIIADTAAQFTQRITLSYTFHTIDIPQEHDIIPQETL